MIKEVGVTLVELMIILLVSALLVLIAVPSFTHLVKDSNANGETNKILDVLALVRSESIKKSHVVTLCKSLDHIE